MSSNVPGNALTWLFFSAIRSHYCDLIAHFNLVCNKISRTSISIQHPQRPIFSRSFLRDGSFHCNYCKWFHCVLFSIYLFAQKEGRIKLEIRLPCPRSQVIWGSGKPFAKQLMRREFPRSVDVSCGSIVQCGATEINQKKQQCLEGDQNL